MTRFRALPGLGALLLTLGIGTADAQRVLNVPANYTTIQAAIDAAGTGDSVVVAPGTYAENIDFNGKAIAVRSTGGAAVTTIDARGTGSVVTFRNGEGRRSEIAGFTLTGGIGTPIGVRRYGGGVYCEHASPTIRQNLIHRNIQPPTTAGAGAGIACREASPLIDGNSIEENVGYDGGGIYCERSSAPRIVHNVIHENIGYRMGGGVAVVDSAPTFDGNRITSNRSGIGAGVAGARSSLSMQSDQIGGNHSDGFAAGGLYLDRCSVFLVNAFLTENTAQTVAGAMAASASTLIFTNCTVFDNWSREETGGLLLSDCDATFTNTILWENGGTFDLGELHLQGRSVARVSHCNLEGGQIWGVSVEPNSTLVWGPGMIDADPMVSVPYLAWASPCRDAATVNAPGFPATDFEGDPRSAVPDIGADEFSPWIQLTEQYRGGPINLEVSGPPGSTVWWAWSTSTRRLDPPITVPGLSGSFALSPPVVVIPLGRVPSSSVITARLKLPPGYPRPASFAYQALVSTRFTRRFLLAIE